MSKPEVCLTPFEYTDLSGVASREWTRESLEIMLADLVLNKDNYPQLCGERMAYEKGQDLVTFELKQRAKEGQ